MAAEMVVPEGFEALKEENLRTAMTVAEGIEVIRRVLVSWKGPQILASPVAIEAICRSKHCPNLPQKSVRELFRGVRILNSPPCWRYGKSCWPLITSRLRITSSNWAVIL